MSVKESEMLNLGYISVEKIKNELGDKTIKELFQGKYHYKNNKMYGKDGNEFACLELLDQIPLIDDTTMKINFNLESFIKLSFNFLWNKIKIKKGKSAAQGNYSKSEVKGLHSIACAMGYRTQARASQNSWIVLTEYNNKMKLIAVRAAQIDGVKLKADTWYILENKKFVEVKE